MISAKFIRDYERMERMKARCIRGVGRNFTTGKEYEVVSNDGNYLIIICNDGEARSVLTSDFTLLPDEPAAKSDWMRVTNDDYLNMVTGLYLHFMISADGKHFCDISTIQTERSDIASSPDAYADSFASLVGHDWSDK